MPIDMEKLMPAAKILQHANFIYIIGNGGAASMADHLACDFLKLSKKKAFSLVANSAIVTALGNDVAFEDIFVEQLKNGFNFQNDVLLALSSSGKSTNVLQAMQYVHRHEGKVIGISKLDGGNPFKSYCTVWIPIATISTQECEEMMLKIGHLLCFQLQNGTE